MLLLGHRKRLLLQGLLLLLLRMHLLRLLLRMLLRMRLLRLLLLRLLLLLRMLLRLRLLLRLHLLRPAPSHPLFQATFGVLLSFAFFLYSSWHRPPYHHQKHPVLCLSFPVLLLSRPDLSPSAYLEILSSRYIRPFLPSWLNNHTNYEYRLYRLNNTTHHTRLFQKTHIIWSGGLTSFHLLFLSHSMFYFSPLFYRKESVWVFLYLGQRKTTYIVLTCVGHFCPRSLVLYSAQYLFAID